MNLFRTRAGWMVETENGRFTLPAEPDGALTAREDLPEYLAALRRPRGACRSLRRGGAAGSAREAGSLGGGRDVFPQPHGADGRVEGGQRQLLLRSGLQRRAAGALLQGRPLARGGTRRHGEDSTRCPLERARTGARAADLAEGAHPRLYGRQRHELARHRRGEPALSSPGEGLRRILRGSARRSSSTRIRLRRTLASTVEIRRGAGTEFTGSTSVSEMKRDFRDARRVSLPGDELPERLPALHRNGRRSPDGFTLQPGDEILVTVGLAGTLRNTVG